jgi:hypothetical protein
MGALGVGLFEHVDNPVLSSLGNEAAERLPVPIRLKESFRGTKVPEIAAIEREVQPASLSPQECAHQPISQRNGFVPTVDGSL